MVRFPIRLVDTFVSPQQPVSQPDEKKPVAFSGPSDRPGPRHPLGQSLSLNRAGYQHINAPNAGPKVLKPNPVIDAYISTHASDFMSPEKEIATILSAKIKQQWGIEVDPDKTYLVTFKDNGDDEKDVVEKITLTQAALKNRQDVTIEDNEGWFRKIAKDRKSVV